MRRFNFPSEYIQMIKEHGFLFVFGAEGCVFTFDPASSIKSIYSVLEMTCLTPRQYRSVTKKYSRAELSDTINVTPLSCPSNM